LRGGAIVQWKVETNKTNKILIALGQTRLGPDSPWTKFALAQLLTDLKKKWKLILNQIIFKLKIKNQLKMDFTRNEFQIKSN
jgi:hypothetical protein